jgi:flagellar protein FliO/FliZ
MESNYLRAALSLIFVVGLILLSGWALRRWDVRAFGLAIRARQGARLKVLEQLPLDAKRRLAIIQCDNAEYLLVSGVASEQLIPLQTSQVTHE